MNITLSIFFSVYALSFNWILKLFWLTKVCYFMSATEFEGYLLMCFHLKLFRI